MSDTTDRRGLGLPTVLFLIFLVLKLTHVIHWSWWWVTAPLWISFALAAALLVTAGIIADRRKRKAELRHQEHLAAMRARLRGTGRHGSEDHYNRWED